MAALRRILRAMAPHDDASPWTADAQGLPSVLGRSANRARPVGSCEVLGGRRAHESLVHPHQPRSARRRNSDRRRSCTDADPCARRRNGRRRGRRHRVGASSRRATPAIASKTSPPLASGRLLVRSCPPGGEVDRAGGSASSTTGFTTSTGVGSSSRACADAGRSYDRCHADAITEPSSGDAGGSCGDGGGDREP